MNEVAIQAIVDGAGSIVEDGNKTEKKDKKQQGKQDTAKQDVDKE